MILQRVCECSNVGFPVQFLTDYWYGASADYQAKTTVRDGNPAYFYIYKYRLENSFPNDWEGERDAILYIPYSMFCQINNKGRAMFLGTPHSAEIAPLFGYPLLELNAEALAHSQFPASILAGYQFTQRDVDYSTFLIKLWTNFAKFW